MSEVKSGGASRATRRIIGAVTAAGRARRSSAINRATRAVDSSAPGVETPCRSHAAATNGSVSHPFAWWFRPASSVISGCSLPSSSRLTATSGQSLGPKQPDPDAMARPLARSRRCYVCKEYYRLADAFYHRLCPPCARENAERRSASTHLTGRRPLLTGGRVKIGFQLALMLLRDGAELLITTRFPRDAQRRFEAAPGSARWLDRLTVLGIDLRDPRQLLGLAESLRADGKPLDILVNNAAQTVRRPPSPTRC
jgi:short chain dehydrogenase